MNVDLTKMKLLRKGVVVRVEETQPMVGKIFIPKTARERTALGRIVVSHEDLPELPLGSLVFYDVQASVVSIGDSEQRLAFMTKDQILALIG